MSNLLSNSKVEEAKRIAREKINENVENRKESLSNSAIMGKTRNSLASSTPTRSRPKITKLFASAPPKSQTSKDKTTSDNMSGFIEGDSFISENIDDGDTNDSEEEIEKQTEIESQSNANESELVEQSHETSDEDEDNEDFVPDSEEEDDEDEDSIFNELEEISPEEVYELKKDAYLYKQVVEEENKPLDRQFLMYTCISGSIIIILCILWMKFSH